MFVEYYRHLLRSCAHAHFPDFERPVRMTIEDEKFFTSIIREYNQNIRVDPPLLRRMKTNFLAYLKRRNGSYKHTISPCTGTIGRWNYRRSLAPVMEMNYKCYDSVYYKNWIDSPVLDRLTWNNIIVVMVEKSYCPHGTKCGVIFIID